MKKEQVLNPKLRFPKFELMWKLVRLENVFEEFRSGNGITSQQISEVGEYPVYGGMGFVDTQIPLHTQGNICLREDRGLCAET